jgi:hypothetical protein
MANNKMVEDGSGNEMDVIFFGRKKTFWQTSYF